MKNLKDKSNRDFRTLSRTEKISLAKKLYELAIRKAQRPLDFFKPQDYQVSFWQSIKRIIFLFGGNRCGKTLNGAAKTVKTLEEKPGAKGWANTWAAMSVPVQQKKIFSLLNKDKLDYCKYSEQNGFANRVLVWKNGSILRFKTYDQGADAFQGEDEDIIWNDEECPEDIFKEQMARLIDRNGLMLNTMTPVNGMTWTYDYVFEKVDMRNLIDHFFWDTFMNKKINQDALRRIIGTYDKKMAEVRSKGSFLNLNSGRLYYAFDRLIHKKKLQVRTDLPLRLTFDFNVDPMTTSICQIVPGSTLFREQKLVLNILEAVNTADCNTRRQCEILQEKLKGWEGQIIIYGDASNQRRTESADVNETNWIIVKMYFPESGRIIYKVPSVNPNIKERIGWVNAKMNNFNNEIGLYVNDEGCEPVIRDLEQGTWDITGTKKLKDAAGILNHNSDNIDYLIAEEFPLLEEAFAISDSLPEYSKVS